MEEPGTCADPVEVESEKELLDFHKSMEECIASGVPELSARLGTIEMVLGLPPLGEGDMSVVLPLKKASHPLPSDAGNLCVKVAKQHTICRECLVEELAMTKGFLDEGILVPRIHYMDENGRFAVKDFIEGESVTSLYMRFSTLPVRTQSLILEGLEKFLSQLLSLFERKPESKVSISPNNIYILREGNKFRSPLEFVLIDPGPSRVKDYSGLSFDKYWNDLLPNRIAKYERTGYLQWIVPREVSEAEYEEAREFEIFRDISEVGVLSIMNIATTVEFDTGQIILKEGTIGESFYLLLEGEVMLRKGNFAKSRWEIRLKSGSVLGEMGFLLKVPRSMTAAAATNCKLIEIPHDKFDDLLSKDISTSYKLLRNISKTLAERLYNLDLAYHKLLDSMPEPVC